jgi:Zn-dependent peptidase ImmA (M78 family)/transcriptional regulator with XRE-family HTH domain
MTTVPVNPKILQWARESAGLTLLEAAKKLHLHQTGEVTPEKKLESLENGIELPTRPLLLKMSQQYRRPLLTFYLEQPPKKGDRGEDFRRLPDEYAKTEEGLVDALVRDVTARQGIVRAALEDEDEAVQLSFVGSANMDQGVNRVCEFIQSGIGFDLEKFRGHRKVSDAFAYLREQVETAGIFVLVIGDLGSHHSKISLEAFRGFALADPIAPFVIINDQDSRAAWSFTLLHELTHVWLGKTGISGTVFDNSLERFCNDVASILLLPATDLDSLEVTDATKFDLMIERINSFAEDRNISRSMVAYRLFRTNRINEDVWIKLKVEFRKQWQELRAALRKQAQEQEGGPTYYMVKRQRIGDALIELVARMMDSGTLTPTKAGKVLGVKPRNVYEMFQQAS